MQRISRFGDTRILRPTETVMALGLLSQLDLLRLKCIAKLHARDLPDDYGWEELLQEALTKVVTDQNATPPPGDMLAFVAELMKSLKDDHWQRRRTRAPRDLLRIGSAAKPAKRSVRRNTPSDPERAKRALGVLTALEHLVHDDPVAQQIVSGLAQGHAARDIRRAHQLSSASYDAARRVIRLCLLREGLTSQTPAPVSDAKRITSKTTASSAALTQLAQLLAALTQELVTASEEELTAAAKDLRMDLQARESAAYAGLKFPGKPQVADFFDPDVDVLAQIRAFRQQARLPSPTNAREPLPHLPPPKKPTDST